MSNGYNTWMRLILIGPMASGKSTVGRRLSKRLKLDFIDVDEEVEKSEPIIESNDGASLESEYSEDNNSENSLNEFDGEDRISSEEDEEFNQETEEELLDIPTFLRRQAN